MNSNRKFDVSLDETLLWHTMNLMPLFRGLKGRKYQLPVVIFYVRPLVSVNSCCINLDHTGSDGAQLTIISYNIYQTLKLLVAPWPHWTRWCTSHNHQLQYLSNSETTSNSCCINLGLTGPDGVQATIISYNIYQTLKLLVTHVVLALASLDQMVYKSQS